ncbi:Uncharacterised protein [Streptococcus pneumoniae]|nr:Uncharacterised protein [Streptococcus pneumoniae]
MELTKSAQNKCFEVADGTKSVTYILQDTLTWFEEVADGTKSVTYILQDTLTWFEEIFEEYKNSLIPLKWELESFFLNL